MPRGIPLLLAALMIAAGPGASGAAAAPAGRRETNAKAVRPVRAPRLGAAKVAGAGKRTVPVKHAAVPRSTKAVPPTPASTTATPAQAAAARAVAVVIRGSASGALKRFYAERGFWPLWAGTGRIGPEADALLDHLASADLDGLKPASYDVPALRRTVAAAKAGDPAAVARAELALSRAFGRYAGDMRRPPRVKMTWLDPTLKLLRPAVAEVLRAAAMPAYLADHVRTMGWMNPHYVRIRGLIGQVMASGAAATPPDLLRRLRLNLDRARLLPGPWTQHIVVDAASGTLFYYGGGRQQGMMKVVVGTPETPTPMLAGMVRYAIANPYWNVPTDLAQRRIAPKMVAGASLATLRYEALADWSATPARLDPATVDWPAIAAGRQEIRLRQLPGGSNAMGKVKFMFPNDQGIYLHDTPDKTLMAKADRHLSNGCVRLADAPRLGRWLLGKPLALVSKAPEQAIALARPVPVYLTYLTATDAAGPALLPDVYRRDE